jgi:hypothetical protein
MEDGKMKNRPLFFIFILRFKAKKAVQNKKSEAIFIGT